MRRFETLYSLKDRLGVGAGLAPFGLASAVTPAASFTVLQEVDGIALKRAVEYPGQTMAGERRTKPWGKSALDTQLRWTGLSPDRTTALRIPWVRVASDS
jgi:hypothetical protein